MVNKSKKLCILVFLALLPAIGLSIEAKQAGPFIGQDLRLSGDEVLSYQLSSSEHSLVFQKGCVVLIGGSEFSSDRAVVWIENIASESAKPFGRKVKIYLEGNVSTKKTGQADQGKEGPCQSGRRGWAAPG